MSELPPVSPGEIIASDHINDIADRSIQRYATEVDRDAENPTPVQGELAYIESTNQIQVWGGSAWSMGGGGTLSGPLTQTPGGILQNAAAGGVLSRWNGDGNTDAQRHYEWRRSASGGVLELWGITSGGAATLALSIDDNATVRVLHEFLAPDGSLPLPGIAFNAEPTTGIIRPGNNQIGFVGSGNEVARFDGNGAIQFFDVYDSTTGTAANLVIHPTLGLLQRSTSARKYKSDIQPAPQLADLELSPVSFHHDGDDTEYLGFIADDMPIEEAIVRGDSGEVENYDLRAVVAILAAKVARLEAQLG